MKFWVFLGFDGMKNGCFLLTPCRTFQTPPKKLLKCIEGEINEGFEDKEREEASLSLGGWEVKNIHLSAHSMVFNTGPLLSTNICL